MPLLPFANAPGSSGGSGTVTSVSVTTANGVSGSVANPTTTPAISLTLGAITPSSVNSVVLSGSSTPTLAVTGTSSISGSNTGDQTITLTGDVTGSGTGSFATTIKTNVSLAGNPTTTTQSPSDNSTKIATTAYVDNAVLGQNFKEAVGAATTANLVGVYSNGSSGVGATFTYTATGVDTIDGVTLTLGMRVLLKNQTTGFQNGIYTVTTAGAIGIVGILTRATDANQSSEWKTGDSVFITAGTTQSTTTWAYTGVDSPTIGTDSLTFVQTAGQGSFTAGNGISIIGNSIAIDTSVTVDKTTAQTLTNKSLTTPKIASLYQDSIGGSNLLTMPATTDTLVGKATTDTFTHKTYDTAGTGNVFKINGTGITDKTGTGKVVLDGSPVLVTPNLGTPSAATLTNATGLPISTGVSGLGTGVATFLATPSSANLAMAVTDESGSGALVFATSPSLTTPIITTPTIRNWNNWEEANETWTYASGDGTNVGTFTVAGVDLTTKYQAGDKVKFTQTTVKYAFITKVAFSTDTTITIYMGTDYTIANATITANYYSKSKSPQDFPMSRTKWDVKVTNTSGTLTSISATTTPVNDKSISITVPIGAWNLGFSGALAKGVTGAGNYDPYAGLDTANNTLSDLELVAANRQNWSYSSGNFYVHVNKDKDILLSSSTVYYLNVAVVSGGGSVTAGFRGDVDTTVVIAKFLYL